MALLVLLLIVDPLLACGVGATLILGYAGIFAATSVWIKRIGQERFQANKDRFKIVAEAFSAIKEVKIAGLERTYIKRFSKPKKFMRKDKQRPSDCPDPVALEAIAFGGMLLVILYLMAKNDKFTDALPIIALYTYAGYRLVPALQQIYGALTLLRFASSGIDALHEELKRLDINNHESDQHHQ